MNESYMNHEWTQNWIHMNRIAPIWSYPSVHCFFHIWGFERGERTQQLLSKAVGLEIKADICIEKVEKSPAMTWNKCCNYM